MHEMTTLRLASASPRRAVLLSRLGLSFEVVPSELGESPASVDPATAAAELARDKALGVAADEGVVLGADTVVAHDGQVIGKPAGRLAARSLLERLSGSSLDVISALCVTAGGSENTKALTTRVLLRPLDQDEISAYLASGAGDDKAGALELQGRAAGFVALMEGCASNTWGLPLCLAATMLGGAGVEVPEPPACSGVPGPGCPVVDWS